MSIQLTEQQHQALALHQEDPPVVVDPLSNVTYVLVRADTSQPHPAAVGGGETAASNRGSGDAECPWSDERSPMIKPGLEEGTLTSWARQ